MPKLWGNNIKEDLVAWKKIDKFEFYLRTRSIVMVANRSSQLASCIIFHSWYSLRGSRSLKKLSLDILTSEKMDYSTIFLLAKQYNIPYIGATSSAIPKTDLPINSNQQTKIKIAQLKLELGE